MKRLIIAITLMCLLVLSFAGCKNASLKNQNQGIKISIMYPTSREMGDKGIAEFKEWFAEKYPGVELNLVASSVYTANETVKSELRHDSAPDVFVITEYDTFVDKGTIADITDAAALTRFRKSSVRELERNGRVYALPIGGGKLFGLMYNKTLFAKYGLDQPKTTESIFDLIARVDGVIKANNLPQRAISASMLYPSATNATVNLALASDTQTRRYMNWLFAYYKDEATFTDDEFRNYMDDVARLVDEQPGDPASGKLFTKDNLINSIDNEVESFLKGNTFMCIGDITRCYKSFSDKYPYGGKDVVAMGVHVGSKGVGYVGYVDDLYLCVNANVKKASPRKQEIINELLNHIAGGNEDIRNIFTFNGEYYSVYLDGVPVRTIDDPFFSYINTSLDCNYVIQGSNSPYATIFGRCLIAWKNGNLGKIIEEGKTNREKIIRIMEMYRNTGINLFEKSDEPIGTSPEEMPYDSNMVRTRETQLGNQVADMARSYMNADFALINAGGIRATIPKGDVSVSTFNSVFPYTNYLVKVRMKGSTLKKVMGNAYDVGPLRKAGQFGCISGLKVVARTKPAGYELYKSAMEQWSKSHPNPDNAAEDDYKKELVQSICSKDPKALNLEVVSVTDSVGKPIEDDETYTVAMPDYLLKDKDGYTMIGILNSKGNPDAGVVVMDRKNTEFVGTVKDLNNQIASNTDTILNAFVNWLKEGNKLEAKKDGRLKIENLIYLE